MSSPIFSSLLVKVTVISLLLVMNVHAEDFGYDALTGPSKWGSLSKANTLCDSGKQQSPVNLPLQTLKVNAIPRDFTLPSITTAEIENKVHTFQFKPTDNQFRGMTIDGERYELKQFHMHVPSEHRVNGVHFDGEFHFVHMTATNKTSVVAMFIKETLADNPNLNSILRSLPTAAGSKSPLTTLFNTAEVVNATRGGVFIYNGSLTVPPCTEGVKWFVTNTPMNASPAQLQTISNIIGFSSRPVMSNENMDRLASAPAATENINDKAQRLLNSALITRPVMSFAMGIVLVALQLLL